MNPKFKEGDVVMAEVVPLGVCLLKVTDVEGRRGLLLDAPREKQRETSLPDSDDGDLFEWFFTRRREAVVIEAA